MSLTYASSDLAICKHRKKLYGHVLTATRPGVIINDTKVKLKLFHRELFKQAQCSIYIPLDLVTLVILEPVSTRVETSTRVLGLG